MKKYFPFFLLPVLIVFISRNNPFFWDTIYHSQVAQWFFEHGFNNFILPPGLDAGHPPFFAVYLDIIWKVFGKNLIISHLAVLPFALGIYWQLFRLVSYFFEEKYHGLCLLLVAFEPTLLTQCTMVSYDLGLVFFYLLGVNSIIKRQNSFLLGALMGLAAIGVRGIIACPALFLTDVVLNRKVLKGALTVKYLLPYFPALVFICGWLFYHYSQTGWAILTPNANRSSQREIIRLTGMFRNVGIIGWRLIDYGRIGILIVFLFCLPGILKQRFYKEIKFQSLFIISIVSLVIFSIAFIPFSNPIGHRYYMVVYLLFILFVSQALIMSFKGWKLNAATAFLIIMLLSGHYWQYPDKIAKGWDSSMAHLPWFGLRVAMINFIDKQHISYNETGTDFPNTFSLKETDLAEDKRVFAEKDLARNKYVFQSNIMNGFTDKELDELKTHWNLVQEYKKAGVYVRLYKKQ